MKKHWRLPRGVDELLPPAAWQLEVLRRKVLDVFVGWGFDYVDPPVIEYLDSLLVGSGEDLDLQTLKVVDQVSGRQLGVRSDMTSQAVRIDAHSRITDDIQRLCYAGTVVFANPQIAHSSRVPFKAGAEIFGSAGLDADAEVVRLMLEVLQVAGVQEPVLLLGHMGIFHGLVDALLESGDLDPDDETALFRAVQRKAQSDIKALLGESTAAEMMVALPTMMGVGLDDARDRLRGAPQPVADSLANLAALADRVKSSDCSIRFDVAELSGYGYHNGPVFAVYHPRHGRALAQGGRYDGIGEVFGRRRAATGFDVDLKQLLPAEARDEELVFAPAADDESLTRAVSELRKAGHRVRCALAEDESVPEECTSVLKLEDGEWRVSPRQRSLRG